VECLLVKLSRKIISDNRKIKNPVTAFKNLKATPSGAAVQEKQREEVKYYTNSRNHYK